MTSWFFGTRQPQRNLECSSLTESLLGPLREQLQLFKSALEEKNAFTTRLLGQQIVQNLLVMRPALESALKQNVASCPAEHQLIEDALWIINDFANRWRDTAHIYDIIEWYLNNIDQWELQLVQQEQEEFTEQYPCVVPSSQLLQSVISSLAHFLQQPRDYSFYLRTLQPQIVQLQQLIQSTAMMNRKCAQEQRFLRQAYDLLTRAAQVMQNLYNDYEEDFSEEMNLAQTIDQFDTSVRKWLSTYQLAPSAAAAGNRTLQTQPSSSSSSVRNRFVS